MNQWYRFMVGLMVVVAATSCDLPGITLDSDPVPPDDAVLPVCEPTSRTCTSDNTLLVCSNDGTDFDIRVCGANESCVAGYCTMLQNTCERGQPFAVSHGEVVFDVRADFKVQRQTLTLHNCGTSLIVLEQVSVRGPTGANQQPIFSLAGAVPSRLKLFPGEEVTMVVEYQPVAGLSQVAGTLDLGIITSGFANYSIPISTRSDCAAITSKLDFEFTDPESKKMLWVQNCGTEKVRITGIDSDFNTLPTEKLPRDLLAGQHLGIEVSAPAESGFFSGRVGIETEKNGPLQTFITGHVVESCTPLGISVGEWEEVSPLVVPPQTVLFVRGKDVAEENIPVYNWANRPVGSHAQVVRFGRDVLILPDMIGTYDVNNRWVSTTGVSCESAPIVVHAIPSDPIYVELSWQNVGDLIPDDTGPGKGVNLNLHVAARLEDGSTRWGTDVDCNVEQQRCGQGRLKTSSWTGERPEVVVFSESSEGLFDVGVHASNLFGFTGAGATVTVYSHGQLVHRASAYLSANDTFWVVGRFDATHQTFTSINSIFDGIPR